MQVVFCPVMSFILGERTLQHHPREASERYDQKEDLARIWPLNAVYIGLLVFSTTVLSEKINDN
jgi:hypothetical protein